MSYSESMFSCPENVIKIKTRQTSSIHWSPMYLSLLSKIYRQLTWTRTAACQIKVGCRGKKNKKQKTKKNCSSLLNKYNHRWRDKVISLKGMTWFNEVTWQKESTSFMVTPFTTTYYIHPTLDCQLRRRNSLKNTHSILNSTAWASSLYWQHSSCRF